MLFNEKRIDILIKVIT